MSETLPYGLKGTIDRPSIWTPEFVGWFIVGSLVLLLLVMAVLLIKRRGKKLKATSAESPLQSLKNRADHLKTMKDDVLSHLEKGQDAETMSKFFDYCSEVNLLLREFCGYALKKNAKDMTVGEFEASMAECWSFSDEVKFDEVIGILRLTDRIRFGGISGSPAELIGKQNWDEQIQNWIKVWDVSQTNSQPAGVAKHES